MFSKGKITSLTLFFPTRDLKYYVNGPVVVVAPDPNTLFLILFWTDFHVVGRCYLLFRVHRLLGSFSISMASLDFHLILCSMLATILLL